MIYRVSRDYIGYGERTPDPRWPNGAKLAVNFVINFEEGSEPSINDGDGFTETGVTDAYAGNQGLKGRDLAAEGMFEYGGRAGFWRLMRLFAEREMRPTIFGCALALERHPPAVAAIRAAGLDLCCHGWRWVKHFLLSEAEEREHIARAVASLRASMGEAPPGWYCRYGPSENTRRLLLEHGGFLYDSDSYADDLPFWVDTGAGGHLVVPYSLTTNDGKMLNTAGTGEAWFGFVRDAFDMLLDEGRKGAPKMLSVGLHMRLIGHPARAAGLARLLDHVAAQPDVWVARRLDIARHWMAEHPWRCA